MRLGEVGKRSNAHPDRVRTVFMSFVAAISSLPVEMEVTPSKTISRWA